MASNNNREEILTPTGRFVQGSLYTPKTTDMEGRPLVYKTGDKQGQPRTDYYVAIAIPKQGETHWASTPWGAKIWAVGHKGFPKGEASSRSFAWKITDGDSLEPNRKGTVPANCEGFAGCWILKFNGSEAPSLLRLNDHNKTEPLTEKDAIKPGDYIQIQGYVTDNESAQQPGVFLNHKFICFRGFGERIVLGVDPDSVGFGGDPLPVGASPIPVGGFIPPSTPLQAAASPVAPVPATTPPMPLTNAMPAPAPLPLANAVPAPAPYPQILNAPPVPTAPPLPVPAPAMTPARIMTAKAQATYEQYIANGWTDVQLIQHGIMQP